MTSQFESYSRTLIRFGCGTLGDIGNLASRLGDKALLVTGRSSMRQLGVMDRVKKLLKVSGVDSVDFEAITPNPDIRIVQEGVNIGRKNNINLIIALGGGSAIDAGKAIAAAVRSPFTIKELFHKKNGAEVTEDALPVLAVPTTAGTGSELSKGAILNDEEEKSKGGLRSEYIIPRIALVDPELTLSLSEFMTAETGFDAFTHAFETFFSKAANLMTRMHSETSLRLVGKYLPIAMENGRDINAREHLAFASMLMGYNLAYSSTCLPHRLQYPLAVNTGASHGCGLSTLYPAWLGMLAESKPEDLRYAVNIWSNGRTSDWIEIVPSLSTLWWV